MMLESYYGLERAVHFGGGTANAFVMMVTAGEGEAREVILKISQGSSPPILPSAPTENI
jgi:hypothetical protein